MCPAGRLEPNVVLLVQPGLLLLWWAKPGSAILPSSTCAVNPPGHRSPRHTRLNLPSFPDKEPKMLWAL